jgi:hypothetical protein
VFNRELEYERSRSYLDTTFKIGLQRNFELHASLPLVFSDRTDLKFAEGVTQENSTIDPSDQRIDADLRSTGTVNPGFFGTYRFFDISSEGAGVDRSGFGDVTLGLAWSPLESTPEEPFGTLVLGFDYTLPSAQIRSRTNDAVGRGVHNLRFTLAASRPIEFAEPYFAFTFDVPIAANRSLFQDSGSNQRLTAPGAEFKTRLGSEITMFRDAASNQSYTLAGGFEYGYRFEGRDYTPLSDAFSRSSCNGLTPAEAGYRDQYGVATAPNGNAYNPPSGTSREFASCGWVVQAPANATDGTGLSAPDTRYVFDGISDVEGFGTIGGHVQLNLQFSRYFELRVNSVVEWDSPHYLTNADAGDDKDGDDSVDLQPDGGERNPTFNLAYDAQGRRFRTDGTVRVTWGVTAALLL